MDVLDLKGSLKFSPDHHVYSFLAQTPHCSISIVGWEPGQTSPIHSHPSADEIYHVLEGEGFFDDGRKERRLGPGDTVIFPAGEVHRVRSITRMALFRVQAGADRHPESVMTEPKIRSVVVKHGDDGWRAVNVPGVSVKPMRRDAETGASTALVRFEPGARFPAHNHPAGEEVFVLEGDVTIGPDCLKAGDYLYTPPNGKHAASSEGGCVFLVTLPKPVEILED